MSAVRKGTAAVLILSMFVSTTALGAQTPAPAATTSVQPAQSTEMVQGLLDGEMLGEGQATGGMLGAGLGMGFLTPFVGVPIGYFIVGPSPLSAEAALRSQGKGSDYQLGFHMGWERKTQSKRRKSFLIGGLIGTAALIGLVAATAE